jgi:hypothetical protein
VYTSVKLGIKFLGTVIQLFDNCSTPTIRSHNKAGNFWGHAHQDARSAGNLAHIMIRRCYLHVIMQREEKLLRFWVRKDSTNTKFLTQVSGIQGFNCLDPACSLFARVHLTM